MCNKERKYLQKLQKNNYQKRAQDVALTVYKEAYDFKSHAYHVFFLCLASYSFSGRIILLTECLYGVLTSYLFSVEPILVYVNIEYKFYIRITNK